MTSLRAKYITLVFLIITLMDFNFGVWALDADPVALTTRPQVEYTPNQLRDPFKSYVIKEVKPEKEEEKIVKPALDLSKFKVVGVIWGVNVPQAIINGQVLTVGDLIEGAEILSIEKNGISLSYDGQTYDLAAPGQGPSGERVN